MKIAVCEDKTSTIVTLANKEEKLFKIITTTQSNYATQHERFTRAI